MRVVAARFARQRQASDLKEFCGYAADRPRGILPTAEISLDL
jgi:hypothetical protein